MRLIIGLVILIVGTIQVYKTARRNGHLPGRWALLNLGLGIVLQLVIPIGITMVIALAIAGAVQDASAITPIQFEKIAFYGRVVGIVGVVLSIVPLILILRHVLRVPDRPVAIDALPPPPPVFGDNIQ